MLNIEKACFVCYEKFSLDELLTAYTSQGILENAICSECLNENPEYN